MQHSSSGFFNRIVPVVLLLIALSVLLACRVAGSQAVAGRSVILTRLPTLTRTPLPTLTPTGSPVQATSTAAPVDLANTGPGSTQPVSDAQAAMPVPHSDNQLPEQPAVAPQAADNSAQTNAGESTPAVAVAANPASPTATLEPPTATPLPTEAPPTETPSPTATATAAPPTETPVPTPTPTPSDWAFEAVRIHSVQPGGGLLLVGNVTNNTGSAQLLSQLSGVFYGSQGEVLPSDGLEADWPAYVLPPGGRTPFEIVVEGIQEVTGFDLTVESEPSGEPTIQEFEFSDVNQWQEDASYCVKGKLKNLGGDLQEYLIVVLVLYDGQEQVINFGNYGEFGYVDLDNGDRTEFEICVPPPNQDVVRHELMGWGK